MEKKKWVKLAGFAMVFLLSLFLCVGCADNGVEDSDEVTFIDFSRESASSRGIESWNENLYPPESLYWTYKATKIRGNYTTGQTSEPKPVVKNGPATGLGTVGPFSVGVWEFELYGYAKCTEDSTSGELVFADADLVYTGKTGTETHNYTTIDKRPDGVTDVQKIIFELTANPVFWNTACGSLKLENMHLTVPENQRFTIDSATTSPVKTFVKTTVSIVSVPTDAKAGGTDITVPFVLAESLTEITEEKVSGADVALNAFGAFKTTGASNEFTPGRYEFEFKAEYKDVFTTDTTDAPQYAPDGWAQIGKISTYPIEIKAGVKTTLSGDINDIQVAEDANAHNVKYDWAVAKITWKDVASNPDGTGVAYSVYTSLKDAVAAYKDNSDAVLTTKNYVELIHDLYIDETVSLSADTPVFTNVHFIRNLTVSGNSLILKPAVTGRDYTFKSGKIVDFSSNSDTVWLCTDSDVSSSTAELTVNAPNDSVFHTGKAKNVTLTAVANTAATASAYSKGYHLGTDRDGADAVTFVENLTVTKGRVELGGRTTVNTLTSLSTTAGNVVLSGKRDAVVQSYGYGATPTVLRVFDTSTKVSSENLYASQDTAAKNAGFKEILLDGNGGTTRISAGKVVASGGTECSNAYIYGIDGMYVTLENNVFKQSFVAGTPAAQEAWNLDFAGEGTYYGGSFYSKKYVTGSNTSGDELYAWWKDNKKVLGGTVYFLRTSTVPATSGDVSEVISGNADGTVVFNGGVTYTFYGTDGQPLNLSGKKYQTEWFGAWGEGAGSSARNLTISIQKATDSSDLLTALQTAKYYTVNDKPASGYKDGVYVVCMESGFLGPAYGAYGVNMGFGGDGDALWGLGRGKVISEEVMSTYKNIAVRCVNTFNTVWAYMDWMNNGTDYGTTVWSGKNRVEGCNDWYIPSAVEALQIYKCGLSLSGIYGMSTTNFMITCSEDYHCYSTTGGSITFTPKTTFLLAGYDSSSSAGAWGGLRIGRTSKDSNTRKAVLIRSF